MKKTQKEKKLPILVTTERGVFVGYGNPRITTEIEIYDARMVVYWPQNTHGVVGLTINAAPSGTKLSPAASKMYLTGVTMCCEASPEAAASWNDNTWS